MKNRNRNILVISLLLCLAVCLDSYAEQEKQVLPPKKIYHDNRKLDYNPAWKNEEIYISENLDNDKENEVIISFVATYRPPEEKKLRGKPICLIMQDEKLPIIQNYIFYQIYDMGRDAYYKLVKTITGMDRMGKVKIVSLDENSPKAVAIFNPGGENYTDLSVYRYEEGGYRLLFGIGSRGEITLPDDKMPAEIKISEYEGKKEQIYIWNRETNQFEAVKDTARQS